MMATIIESDHSTSNWIFAKEHIEKHTPSRKDGIDAKKESWLRKGCCTFIQDAGMRLTVPQLTIATAIMFCHRFFMRQSYTQHDRYVIASTCLFLAGKVEDTPRQLKDVIFITYAIRHKKDKGAEDRVKQSKEIFEHERELLLSGEYLVMNTLSFDLNINHPYKPLLSTIRQFDSEAGPVKHLAQVAWNFVNDGLRTSLGLQFKPHHVAAGAIYLAAKFLKISLPQEGGKPWWTKFDVTPAVLEDVSSQMLELYEQTKDGSGTTGASSRRSKGQPATSKAGGGSKSKTSGHPSTPSLADRAPQASLTSGASMQAGTGAADAQRVGWAQDTQAGTAGGDAQPRGAVPQAGEPLGGAAEGEPGQAAGQGPATGLPPKAEQNGHAPHDSFLQSAPRGESRPAGETENRKAGVGGGTVSDAFAQNGAISEKSQEREFPRAEEAVPAGPAKVEHGAGLVQAVAASLNAAQQGLDRPDLTAGQALDEPMDMDLEDEGPSGASREVGGQQAPREHHGAGSQAAPLQVDGRAQQHVERPAVAAGTSSGTAVGPGEGALPSTSGRSIEAGREGEGRDSKAGSQAPAAAAEPASEEGEIGAEDGEIPASPLSPMRRSRSREEREPQRGGRSRSRERSPSRGRERSRSRDARKRRQGRYSRSRSPIEPSRGRSRSPHRSERRLSGGQRPKGHDGRSRGKEHGEYRERDRERERGRDRYRPPQKDSARHASRYNDAYDRNRR